MYYHLVVFTEELSTPIKVFMARIASLPPRDYFLGRYSSFVPVFPFPFILFSTYSSNTPVGLRLRVCKHHQFLENKYPSVGANSAPTRQASFFLSWPFGPQLAPRCTYQAGGRTTGLITNLAKQRRSTNYPPHVHLPNGDIGCVYTRNRLPFLP